MVIAPATYVRNQLYQVPLAELQPDPAQPRKYLDPASFEELTVSITQHGILAEIGDTSHIKSNEIGGVSPIFSKSLTALRA